MPYVTQADRAFLANVNASINSDADHLDAGRFNFLITSACDAYLLKKGLSYRNINELIGVLECAKLELYRRIAAPYEDTKITANGDVYSKENLR